MPRYNTTFELNIDDLDMIEAALRSMPAENDATRDINDLLGRLHHQKVFYRPSSGVYVGG